MDFGRGPRRGVKEIYFDNSATSFPKPPAVIGSLAEFDRRFGASAGRGAYPRAVATGKILSECRGALAKLFHVSDPRRIIFTLNASDALNLAIHGLPWRPGDRALVSPFEHNSVLRPLHELRDRLDIAVDVMPTDSEGRVIIEKIKSLIRPRTRLISCVHVSNVTGVIQPVEEVGRIAQSCGVVYLVDAAQSAGALPVDVTAIKADLLAFPGHKGLMVLWAPAGCMFGRGWNSSLCAKAARGARRKTSASRIFYRTATSLAATTRRGSWGCCAAFNSSRSAESKISAGMNWVYWRSFWKARKKFRDYSGTGRGKPKTWPR